MLVHVCNLREMEAGKAEVSCPWQQSKFKASMGCMSFCILPQHVHLTTSRSHFTDQRSASLRKSCEGQNIWVSTAHVTFNPTSNYYLSV